MMWLVYTCKSINRNIHKRDGRLALLIVLARISNVQIFGLISDQNALFLRVQGGVGWIIFVVVLLVDSLGL